MELRVKWMRKVSLILPGGKREIDLQASSSKGLVVASPVRFSSGDGTLTID